MIPTLWNEKLTFWLERMLNAKHMLPWSYPIQLVKPFGHENRITWHKSLTEWQDNAIKDVSSNARKEYLRDSRKLLWYPLQSTTQHPEMKTTNHKEIILWILTRKPSFYDFDSLFYQSFYRWRNWIKLLFCKWYISVWLVITAVPGDWYKTTINYKRSRTNRKYIEK